MKTVAELREELDESYQELVKIGEMEADEETKWDRIYIEWEKAKRREREREKHD